MLQLRPYCENCNKKLPPDALDAMICSYECTYCHQCANGVLENVCPNCGGGFCKRPIRPQKAWREGVTLAANPAVKSGPLNPVIPAEHAKFIQEIKSIPPNQR